MSHKDHLALAAIERKHFVDNQFKLLSLLIEGKVLVVGELHSIEIGLR